MPTLFSRIISGEIPSYKITEDQDFFAFLDINPLVKGHTLVVPKTETDELFDLSPEVLGKLLVFARPIAHALKNAFEVQRCGLSVMGFEVPHAHLHLLPINSEIEMNFSRPKLYFSPQEFLEIRNQIHNHLPGGTDF